MICVFRDVRILQNVVCCSQCLGYALRCNCATFVSPGISWLVRGRVINSRRSGRSRSSFFLLFFFLSAVLFFFSVFLCLVSFLFFSFFFFLRNYEDVSLQARAHQRFAIFLAQYTNECRLLNAWNEEHATDDNRDLTVDE